MDDSPEPLPPSAKATSPLFWLVLVVLAGAMLLFSGWPGCRSASIDEPAEKMPGVGSPLPFAYFEPLTGAEKPLQTDDFKGKVVLINYWGPWCGYCAKEFPDLVKVEKKQRANPDFLFVSVSSDGGNDTEASSLAEETAAFLRRYEAEFPTYVDRGGRNRRYLVTLTQQRGFGYPFTLLVDRSGTIVDIWAGYSDTFGAQMIAAVEKALADKPTPTPPDAVPQ